jgi:hypothetical protein
MCADEQLAGSERRALERVALADWSAAAEARVDEVLVAGRRAAVVLLLNGDYEYTILLCRDDDGVWEETGSSNGRPVRGWLPTD